MRIDAKTPVVVLALTALICLLSAGGALASTGGASAPASGSAPSAGTAPKVRPTGIATWFGPGLFGKKTACGQPLTPGVVGVASRTPPCGTLVKVGYHGPTLTAPVLGRGP